MFTILAALLHLLLLDLPPAPNGSTFRDGDLTLTVVGQAKRPHDRIIPRQLDLPGRLHWVWQKEFDALGVKQVNVCEDKDGKLYTYAPYVVWLKQK